MAFGGSSKGVKNEINITPLVDVVLVLLIIFMVITPMLQRGKDVRLPEADKVDEKKDESDPLILSITSDKKIYVESDEVNEEGLSARIKGELAAAPGKRLQLKGDDRLKIGDVRHMMDVVRKAGAKGVALVVQEKKKK
jgi:biopolymer transport protein TolR